MNRHRKDDEDRQNRDWEMALVLIALVLLCCAIEMFGFIKP